MKSVLFALVVTLIYSAHSTALTPDTNYSGNDYIELCETQKLACSAFTRATIDAMDHILEVHPMHRADGTKVTRVFCLPENYTLDQAIAVTIKWLNQVPEFRHFSAVSAIVAAHSQWTCR